MVEVQIPLEGLLAVEPELMLVVAEAADDPLQALIVEVPLVDHVQQLPVIEPLG